MKPLRAISLHQPWATLMAEGGKKLETRHWPTKYRGLLAIHAAQKWNNDLRQFAFSKPCSDYADEFPRGCIVAVGNLHKCLAMDEYPNLLPAAGSDERAFGNYGPGRFIWVFDHVWALSSPVYTRGRQGFWTLSEEETDVVTTLLPDGWEEELKEE